MKKLLSFLVMLTMALTLAACDGATEDAIVDITLESDVTEAELAMDPQEVTEGMEVTVTASEVDGYEFTAWVDTQNDTEVSTERTYTFTVEEAVTLEAVYEEDGGNGGDDTYNLNISSGLDSASWSVSEDGPYEPGDEITLEAVELDTYDFVHWMDTENDTVLSENRSYTFTIDEDTTLEAVYEDTLTADERTAETIVNQATEDTAYLDTLMSDFNVENGMNMTMHMALDMDVPESTETMVYDMTVNMTTAMNDGTRLSKLSFSVSMPEMAEAMDMTMYMEEDDSATTYYINAGVLLDMLQQQESIDLRTLLDLQSDYIHYTVPHNVEGSDQEVVYDEVMTAIYEQLLGDDYQEGDLPAIDDSTLNALFDNMGTMMSYMSFAHLSGYEDVDLTMNRNGSVATGTLSMGGDALEAFAKDMFEEIYTTLELLDENDQLTPYSEVITTQDYNMFMGTIGMIPNMNVDMDYDASTEEMHVDMDIYTLLNFFLEDTEEFQTVNDITMEMTMAKSATLDSAPSNSTNLETVGEEFIQIMTVVDTASYLGDIANDPEITEGTHTLTDLESMGHGFTIPFIDKDMSEVTIDASGETPVYSIELYYTHNAEAVFTGTSVTLSEFGSAIENEPTTRQDVLDILAFVSNDNFELYPVLSDIVDQLMQDALSVDPSMPLPESDVASATEPEFLPRYTDSVLIYHQTPEASTDIYGYAVDATTLQVRDFYSNHYTSASDWTVGSESGTEMGYVLSYFNDTLNRSITVNISSESNYSTGIMYYVVVNDTSSQ